MAQAVAAEIWTLGGMPWTDASAGGSCGPASCTLEIGGIPAGAQGEDLYVFGVDPASGSVSVVETSLRGVAPALVEELDAITRQLWSGDLSTLGLTSVSWLPPPGDRRFRLSYRGGAEEGSPAHDLLLDLDAASVEEP